METESMSSCLYWYRTHSWTVTFQLNGGKVQWEARVCTMFQGKATFRYSSLWKKLFVFLLCRVTKPQLMNMVNQVRMIILLQNHLLRRQQLCHLTGPQIHNPFIPVCWGYSAESWLSLQEPHKWLKHSILTSQLSHSHSLRHPVQGLCMTRKSSSVSKGSNSQDDQHRASSRLPHDHPPNSNPSTSQTSPSYPKRNLTTQMERFLSALNKADTVLYSLFQEARKDLTLINTQKPTQPQLDRNIPFMDEIYDPFKEDEDNGQERVKTETRLNDPAKMTSCLMKELFRMVVAFLGLLERSMV